MRTTVRAGIAVDFPRQYVETASMHVRVASARYRGEAQFIGLLNLPLRHAFCLPLGCLSRIRLQLLPRMQAGPDLTFCSFNRRSLTMSALSSPFWGFLEIFLPPFSSFEHTTTFTPASGLVGFFTASTTTARS